MIEDTMKVFGRWSGLNSTSVAKTNQEKTKARGSFGDGQQRHTDTTWYEMLTAKGCIRKGITPRKINMEPENTPLEEENDLPNHHFQVLC